MLPPLDRMTAICEQADRGAPTAPRGQVVTETAASLERISILHPDAESAGTSANRSMRSGASIDVEASGAPFIARNDDADCRATEPDFPASGDTAPAFTNRRTRGARRGTPTRDTDPELGEGSPSPPRSHLLRG